MNQDLNPGFSGTSLFPDSTHYSKSIAIIRECGTTSSWAQNFLNSLPSDLVRSSWTYLERIKQGEDNMEGQGAVIDDYGYSESPGQPQQWCEDGDVLTDSYNGSHLLEHGTADGSSLGLDNHQCDCDQVHHHGGQSWDHKGQKGFGHVPVEPTGLRL